MTRTFYTDMTTTDKVAESDSENEEPTVAVRAEMSVEPEDVDMGGPSTGSADGDSNTGGRQPKRRGTYMKDGPTVYKLLKPVLKAIKETQAKE